MKGQKGRLTIAVFTTGRVLETSFVPTRPDLATVFSSSGSRDIIVRAVCLDIVKPALQGRATVVITNRISQAHIIQGPSIFIIQEHHCVRVALD